MAYGGSLHFNPLTDTLALPNGETFRFSAPEGDIWPEKGYQRSLEYYQAPQVDGPDRQLQLDPKSQRIQLIEPFAKWNGEDKQQVELLIKVRGKCSELRWAPLSSIADLALSY
jgi:aconitate hydratase